MTTPKGNEQVRRNELVSEALKLGTIDVLASLVDSWHPAQIADAIEALPREQRLLVWQQVDALKRGQVLTEVRTEVRDQLIAATPHDELLAALTTLEADELADLDAALSPEFLQQLDDALPRQSKAQFDSVRQYPDDSAGGLMDADAATVRADLTLDAVHRYLRKLRISRSAMPEHLDSVMVVDRDRHYQGVLPLSDLVSLDPHMTVKQAMRNDVPAIPVLMADTEVARLFTDQDLLSAPVIASDGTLLGRITVDDVMDVMNEQTEHEVMTRAGLSSGTDMFAPVMSAVSRRAIWMGVNLINGFVAAWVIGLFEQSIDKMVALAVLMPVVASMGGVSGNQTLTLVTRGISLGQVGKANASRLVARETLIGLTNGILWAAVVAVVATLWFSNPWLGLVFGAALLLNMVMGAVAGSVVPLCLHRAGIDPALAGGVLLMAVTDVVGFASFLGLASIYLL